MDKRNQSSVETIASLEKRLAYTEAQNTRLLAEKTYLKQLYNRIPLAYQSLDCNGSILEINQTWLETLGYTREEVIGRDFGDFLHPDWQNHFKENFPSFNAIGEILGIEFEMIKKDGSSALVSLYGNIGKDPYGHFQQTHCVFLDITERKKAEEAAAKLRLVRRQLHKAESLERMAGAIAHLFNNQLQVALGNLEFARDSMEADTVTQKYLINAIQANSHSSDVTGLLLTYLGQNISKREPLDLAKICQQSLPGIEAAMPSGISLELNYMPPGPVVVCANASQVQQVLTILITNACEAIRNRTGEVTVVIKTVPASIIPHSHFSNIEWTPASEMFASLEVTDTGCGISKEEMDKIFDPFYTTKFTGRGLGLAVAMSFVKAWGGVIHAKSEVQKGSCFRVFLPLVVDVVPRQDDLLPKPETFKAKGTVLLVDDDPVLCDIMAAVLEHLCFTVFIAISGKEAVALFQKHHNSIDCLLTDLSMPNMNGWETIAALRKIKPDLPAILSSGYDEAHAMDGDYKELPQAFLHKPYTKDDLKNVLNQVLGDATRGGN